MNNNTISIILTVSYESYDIVSQCLTSLSKLKGKGIQIYLLDQTNSLTIKTLIKKIKSPQISFHYIKIPKKSLSFARNTGLAIAKTRFVAFCDIDCEVEKNWIEEILRTFKKTGAAIVGTKIIPRWEKKPIWFHLQKPIQDFYSLLDIADDRIETTKAIGASFALDKEKLKNQCYFDEHLGRRNGKLLGGEETDLSERAIQVGHKVYFTPFTVAYHSISSARMSLGYLIKRLFYGGVSRAFRGGKIQPHNKTRTKAEILAKLLIAPWYMAGYIYGKLTIRIGYISKLFFFSTFLYLVNSVLIFLHPQYIAEFIYNNLPFRESYSPTFLGITYIYVLPVLLGFLLSGCFTSKAKKTNYYYYFNISLFFSMLHSFLFLISFRYASFLWLEKIELAYYVLLIPILYIIGSLPYYLFYSTKQEIIINKSNKQTVFTWITGLLFALLLFCLNLIPIIQSKNLIGADIYYHAPMTRIVAKTLNIFQNPFFKENNNYYYSLTYYILGFISNITNVDIGIVWKFYPTIVASLFIFIYFFLIYRLSKNVLITSLTTLFLLPFYQTLWTDPSIRVMSYLVFIIYLYVLSYLKTAQITMKKILILIFLIFLIFLMIAIHTEIGIHAVIITFFYLVIRYWNKRTIFAKIYRYSNIVKQYLQNINLPVDQKKMSFFNTAQLTFSLFVVYIFVSVYEITDIVTQISFGNLTTFNEIPLSILQPIGIISFICFLGVPYGICNLTFWRREKTRIVLSISLLSLSAVFYFTHLWFIYHRYFTETAYLGLAFVGAYFWIGIIKELEQIKKLIMISLLFVVVGFSILPKYLFITQYTQSTRDNLSSYISTFNLLTITTPINSVILVHPQDIINRYIPWYTGRYIFAGSGSISRSEQWQVLSFCNGPFAKNCNRRQDLSTAFFTNPSIRILQNIKKSYSVDYLLVKRSDELTIKRLVVSDLYPYLILATYNNDYYLYSLAKVDN